MKKYHENTRNFGNALLIVDNAPSYPCSELLEHENGKFSLPPNITPSLQPMDKKTIEALKKL
jgi:hypothetical protein